MTSTIRSLLLALGLLPCALPAQGVLKPGDFQRYVENGRSQMHLSSEVLPLFDAMMLRVRSARSGLRELDDRELLRLAADAGAANFYFPGARAHAHGEVFEELARRGTASDLEIDDYYRTLVAARLWKAAAALAKRFPKAGLEPLPARIQRGDGLPGLHVWDFDPSADTLSRRRLELGPGVTLVVVSHPGCGFSRSALMELERSGELAQVLPVRRYFVAPTFGGLRLTSIGWWNAHHPGSPHALVDQPLDWPFVQRWNTPQFFFLVDGEVAQHVEGWPDADQVGVLMAASRRAHARAEEPGRTNGGNAH